LDAYNCCTVLQYEYHRQALRLICTDLICRDPVIAAVSALGEARGHINKRILLRCPLVKPGLSFGGFMNMRPDQGTALLIR
jgi:hypothetical protein